MAQTIKVVAAILDGQEFILYREDGTTFIIRQGDPRLAGMVATIIPEIRSKQFAMVDIQDEASPYAFAEYEEKSKGFVRFFRVARQKLANIFKASETRGQVLAVGTIPNGIPVMPIGAPTPVGISEEDARVVAEIISHAKPTTDPKFNAPLTEAKHVDDLHGDTIVAITKTNQVIPEIQNMEKHIRHAVDNNAPGMKIFMERLAALTVKRRHSVDDLLQFMKHGDLPIADDGSIIIYKILYIKEDMKGHYMDAYTRKVIQRVGSRVFMAENLVDPSRTQNCSHGLHVAQRSYLGSFHGNVCVLAKVNPEDVIAVPQYNTNKMRVSGYEILAELSREAMSKLKNNQAFTSLSQDQKLFAKALRCEFPPYDQCVEITENLGGGVKIYPRTTAKTPKPVTAPTPETPRTPKTVVALPNTIKEGPDLTAPTVAPKAVVAAVATDKATKPPSRSEQANALFTVFSTAKTKQKKAEAAKELLAFKKKAKVSWLSLGFADSYPIEAELKAAIEA
jgi:hypothetical protein